MNEQRLNPEWKEKLVWSLSTNEYYGLVKTINQNYREELKNIIEDNFPEINFSQTCFVLVGSDGRSERHSQSKTEIVIYTRNKLPINSSEIKNKLLNTLTRFEFPSGRIEIKNIRDKSSVFSSVHGNKKAIFPDRLINSYPIVGDENLYYEVRKRVLGELLNYPKVYKALKNQFIAHRTAMNRGMYRHLQIFDLSERVQLYDEAPNNLRFGFKAAHLRAFQRFMLLLLRFYFKSSGASNLEQISKEFPSNPIEQYYWLRSKGALSSNYRSQLPQVITDEEIINSYEWFLREYHKVQEVYKTQQRPHQSVKVPFSIEEFQKYHPILTIFLYHRSK